MRHVVDHVVDQPHVAIDEVVPGAGFLPQTTVDQLTVDVAQGHGRASSPRKRTRVASEESRSLRVEQLVIL